MDYQNTSSLQVMGMSPNGEILFKYTNPGQMLEQTFGFDIKYYKGHVKDDKDEHSVNMTLLQQDFNKLDSEGLMTFLPSLTQKLPVQYSVIRDQDVVQQQGQYIDQYTIAFNKNASDPSNQEQAFVKVKFSPILFPELIKFEVELNQVPISDGQNKDITVNWKMFDGFDAQGQFYTDSNEQEMEKRVIGQK